MAWFVGIFLTVGWSALQTFRYGVRFFLSKIPIRGDAAILVGLITTLAAVIGLFLLAVSFGSLYGNAHSRHDMALVIGVAVMCGLVGGVVGSLEANDQRPPQI